MTKQLEIKNIEKTKQNQSNDRSS